MSATERLLHLLSQLKPMLPGAAAVVAATLALLPVLLVWSRKSWLRDRRFCITGLFFGLSGRETVHLACAWIRLILMAVFIIGFQKLVLLHYMMLVLPGLIGIAAERGFSARGSGLLWLALQLAGLLSANLVCGYYLEMNGGAGFLVMYVAMGLFLILFSIYLFLNEISSISAQRDVRAEQIWGTEADSDEAD